MHTKGVIRGGVAVCAVALCGLLAGCGARLYSQESDKQATALKEKIAAVSFDETFTTASANHEKVSEAIRESGTRLAEARAKLRLLSLITKPSGFRETLANSWTKLVGNSAVDNNIIAAGLEGYDPDSPAASKVREQAYNLMILGAPKVPHCEARAATADADLPSFEEFAETVPANRAPFMKFDYGVYRQRCDELLAMRTTMNGQFSDPMSDVGGALKAWREVDSTYQTGRDKALALKKRYEDSEKAYQAALKEIADKKPDAEQRAQKLLEQAGHALQALATLEEKKKEDLGVEDEQAKDAAVKTGHQVASQERVAKLEEILALLSGADPAAEGKLKEDVRKQLAAIARIPERIDDVAELYAAAKTARLSPLKLELAYQRQVLTAAERDVDLLQQEIAFRREIYLTWVQRAQEILKARELAPDLPNDRPLHESWAGTPEPAKTRVMQALVHYYRAEAKYGTALDQAALEESARTFQRNLTADQAGLTEWQALAEGQAEILAGFHGSGIRPESLGALLALIAIAVGVN